MRLCNRLICGGQETAKGFDFVFIIIFFYTCIHNTLQMHSCTELLYIHTSYEAMHNIVYVSGM